jgi:DNA-binding NarL/FixJ family response regulator
MVVPDRMELPVDEVQKITREEIIARAAGAGAKNKGAVRVLLADDHKVVRQVLCNFLRLQSFIREVVEAEDGEEAIRQTDATAPDIIIMDINMPLMNGIEATRILSKRYPKIKIIGLSIQSEDETYKAMKEAGAVAYFNKTEDAHTLMEAIKGFAKI